MAIKINGVTVINDQRGLENIGDIGQIVVSPNITSPANNAANVGFGVATIGLQSTQYKNILGVPQGGMQIQIATDSDFTPPVLFSNTQSSFTGNNLVFDHRANLSTGTTYYLRARHFDNENTYSSYGPTSQFTTNPKFVAPAKAVITSGGFPSNTDVNIQPTITTAAFAMDPAGIPQTHVYSDWQISKSPTFANVHFENLANTTNKTSLTLSRGVMEPSRTYYVRVRHASNTFGYGQYSNAAQFTTVAVFSGADLYATAGSFSWEAPLGVTSVSAAVIGGGAGGGGGTYCSSQGAGMGGGALSYKNSISVTPASSYTVVVGTGGSGGTQGDTGRTDGGSSYFVSTGTMLATGGNSTNGGTATGGTGGGSGGNSPGGGGSGGGGAGGYDGNGGTSGTSGGAGNPGSQGAGGGGGGGNPGQGSYSGRGGNGGGTGIFGKGANGTGGAGGTGDPGPGGAGGSGSTNIGNGQAFGGGGGAGGFWGSGGAGQSGGVRVVFGTGRTYPCCAV